MMSLFFIKFTFPSLKYVSREWRKDTKTPANTHNFYNGVPEVCHVQTVRDPGHTLYEQPPHAVVGPVPVEPCVTSVGSGLGTNTKVLCRSFQDESFLGPSGTTQTRLLSRRYQWQTPCAHV